MSTIGYDKDLFVLPFDHRGSFQSKLFGIKGTPTPEETKEIASYKEIIYNGFKKALERGVPREKAGVLIDEQFGEALLADAKKNGIATACPAEKSGQDEFDFEYGSEFGAHIEKLNPTFVKVLVRMNPAGDQDLNQRQTERLKRLSDYCHANGRKFMFELLVPATPEQMNSVNDDKSKYDRDLRPKLMVEAMAALQSAGVEPDLWKLEGMDDVSSAEAVAKQARKGGRDKVGVILLGRGENAEKVHHWLKTAAGVSGFIGFAVGRTTFWEPLKAVKDGNMTPDQASDEIAKRYKGFCDLWMGKR